MGIFEKRRIFQKVAVGIFIIFGGLLVMVTVVAHSRPSGNTRQDMAQAQFIRKEAIALKSEPAPSKESE